MSTSLCQTASTPSSRRSATAVTGQNRVAGQPRRSVLDIWWERVAMRRRLAEMDDHLLRDIGLAREDAVKEARKPFWVD